MRSKGNQGMISIHLAQLDHRASVTSHLGLLTSRAHLQHSAAQCLQLPRASPPEEGILNLCNETCRFAVIFDVQGQLGRGWARGERQGARAPHTRNGDARGAFWHGRRSSGSSVPQGTRPASLPLPGF